MAVDEKTMRDFINNRKDKMNPTDILLEFRKRYKKDNPDMSLFKSIMHSIFTTEDFKKAGQEIKEKRKTGTSFGKLKSTVSGLSGKGGIIFKLIFTLIFLILGILSYTTNIIVKGIVGTIFIFIGVALSITFFVPKGLLKKLSYIGLIIAFLFVLVSGPLKEESKPVISDIRTYAKGTYCSVNFLMHGVTDVGPCWEQEENIEKEGGYETLEIIMGERKTHDGSVPSATPRSGAKYNLDITLKNKNSGNFDINVVSLDVIASPVRDTSHEDRVEARVELPPTLIRPQESYSLRAKFEEENKLPIVSKFIYFFTTVGTQQEGGGSSFFRVASFGSPEEKYDFPFDIDPKTTTRAGPVDVYVFTDPSVIVVDETSNEKTEFDVVIKLYNGGKDGTATIDWIALYQTIENIDEPIIEINCENSESIDCPRNKIGNCLNITEYGEIIQEKSSNEIVCEGIVKPLGRSVDFTNSISVIAGYKYIQEETYTTNVYLPGR